MNCRNCGNQIPDGSTYCYYCGANMHENNAQDGYFEQQYQQDGYYYSQQGYSQQNSGLNAQNYYSNNGQQNYAQSATKTNKNTGKIIGICGGISAVVVIALVIVLFVIGRDKWDTANSYVNATLNGDAKTIMSLIHPKVIDAMEKRAGITRKQIEKRISFNISRFNKKFEGFEVTYDPDNERALNLYGRYVDEKTFLILKEEARRLYGIDNLSDVLEIEATLWVEDETSGEGKREIMTFYIAKIGKSWYLWEFEVMKK